VDSANDDEPDTKLDPEESREPVIVQGDSQPSIAMLCDIFSEQLTRKNKELEEKNKEIAELTAKLASIKLLLS
jgi:hypothetical protein